MNEEQQDYVADDQADVADAPDVEVEDAAPPAPEWSPEDAEDAKQLGWKSPDDWQGEKPAGYIDDPRRYLDRFERIPAVKALKEQTAKIQKDADDRARKLDALYAQQAQSQRDAYESRLAEITKGQRQAASLADTDAYDRLEAEKAKLAPPRQEEPQDEAPQVDPYVQQYRSGEGGKWLDNPILLDTGKKLIDANPAILQRPAQEQVAYAEAELRKMYPAYFPSNAAAPKAQRTQRVDGGGLANQLGGGNGFEKLPPDAKTQFKRFVKEGLFSDDEQGRKAYTNDYNNA
tara:strand:- start:12679 stop:13545 length:867 start_codon:yes stop_codon:yes gene_type:complete